MSKIEELKPEIEALQARVAQPSPPEHPHVRINYIDRIGVQNVCWRLSSDTR